jgi:hypothetical protein
MTKFDAFWLFMKSRGSTKIRRRRYYDIFCRLLATAFILIFAAAVEGAGDPKTLELNRKISEINRLQHSLSERIAVASKMRDQLQKQIDELIKEIMRICDSLQIKSFSAAHKEPRIGYNIKLIHQLAVYMRRIDDRMTYFHSGKEKLASLHRQVIDDLKLIRTLNDMEVDELISNINIVLDEYFPETRNNIFRVENIQPVNPEKIWNQIVAHKPDQQIKRYQD